MNHNITYKSGFLLSFVIVLLFSVNLTGQNKANPFEIVPRLGTIDDSTIPDVSDVKAVVSDTAITTDTVIITDKLNNELLLNPFDVDHVPVRRSAIVERAAKLQTQTGNTQGSDTFLIWFLLSSCIILAILINLRVKLLEFVYKSIFNENILKLFQREEQRGSNVYMLLLYIVFLINIAVLAYLIYTRFGGQQGIVSLLIILWIFSSVYLVKHTGLNTFGKIFLIEKSTGLYSFTCMIFNHAAGMILIPFNFMIAFAPKDMAEIVLWIAVGIIVILLILRTLRGIIIVFEFINDRIFQIFVYLCAFEIAPVMILVKTIMKLS